MQMPHGESLFCKALQLSDVTTFYSMEDASLFHPRVRRPLEACSLSGQPRRTSRTTTSIHCVPFPKMEVMLKHKLWKDIRGFDKPSWEFEIREMQKKDIIADYCLD